MNNQNDFQNWAVDKLSDYIIETHHGYARKAIAEIQKNSELVAQKHATEHPELAEINKTFETLGKAFNEHMDGEEKYLFPYVKKLLNAKNEGTKVPKPKFGSLETPLKHHYEEHDKVSDLMKKIHDSSKNYSIPKDACEEHKTLFNQLQEFEKDLAQHIHLENDVLFGKSIELEKEVVA